MLNFFIFLLIISFIIFYYQVKKGIDTFLIFVAMMIVYFYPILFFDTIYLYTTTLVVSSKAKFLLVLSILFILSIGLLYKKPKKIVSLFNDLNNRIFINMVAFVALFVFLIIYSKIGLLFLSHHDKGYMTLQLGQLEPIYHIIGIILITTIVRYKVNKFYFLILVYVVYDVLLGFRMLTFVFIIQLLLNYKNLKLLKFILFGTFAFIAIIVIKETAYFSRDLSVLKLLLENIIENPAFYSMIFNSESSSISAVFNEVVKQHFLINPIYYIESFLKIFPFLELKDYASYFKGVLFGQEGNSFASGMFSVSYSLFGAFTYALFILFISGTLYFYETKLQKIPKIEIQVSAYSIFSVVIMYHVFRSDLMAIIIYLRSFFIFIFIFYILKLLLLQFKKKKLHIGGLNCKN